MLLKKIYKILEGVPKATRCINDYNQRINSCFIILYQIYHHDFLEGANDPIDFLKGANPQVYSIVDLPL